MKRLGVAGAALPAGALLTSETRARAEDSGRITGGDAAILRFLAAAEILETDLWQHTPTRLGNESFASPWQVLDGDMPTYVNQNTRDESRIRTSSINIWFPKPACRGSQPFQNPPQQPGDRRHKTAKRLTNLMNLTVDTSWFLRYRLSGNPDFGTLFPRSSLCKICPAFRTALALANGRHERIRNQLIANTAGFHFATVEQGGSSLYLSFLGKVTNLEVLRIVGSIGGTEIMHFQTWSDKAGNSPMLTDAHGNVVFPQLPTSPDLPKPRQRDRPRQPRRHQSNHARSVQIHQRASPGVLGDPSVLHAPGRRRGHHRILQGHGSLQGQSDGFFSMVNELAAEADAAVRQAD